MILFDFMNWEWNTPDHIGPGMYSYFHIIWLVIMVGLCIGSYFYAKRFNDPKIVDRTIRIVDITLLITEILKQIMYQFSYYGYFRIDVLPFSFCSVPLFIAFIGALVKNKKVKNACYTFLAFYGVVGGLCAMLYPITLETKLIYISFQTMYWHTMLVTMAFYLIFAKGYGRSYKKEVVPPFIIFVCCTLLAIGLNEVTYHTYLEPRQTPKFALDTNPGSYEWLTYGYIKDDSYRFVKEEDGVFTVTLNYKEGINFYIAYPEGDETYTKYTLVYNDKNDKVKYIEINNNKELILVDEPTSNWKWRWVESDKAVFAMEINGEDYFITFDNDTINIVPISTYNESTVLSYFIKVSVESEDDSADFFFISKHNTTSIPILNLIQPNVPYPVFVLIYISGFFAISSLTWGATFGIRKLVDCINKKEEIE